MNDQLKRLSDVVGAGALLILLSPVLCVVAVLVAVSMGRPVIFRQQRPGLHGEAFTILKFRTMSSATDAKGNLLSDAQRVTRLGRFLRRTSIDELPELVNVLRGDMSLVGPRPLLTEYLPLYSPEQMRRHGVRPGITGWSQINGRNALTWEEKFSLDVWYVDNRSIRLDLEILRMTIGIVVRGEGITHPGVATMEPFPRIGTIVTRRVLVIGGSDQGRQAIDIIEELGDTEIVGVLDRRTSDRGVAAGYPLLGSDEDLAACAVASGATGFVVAIGDNSARHRVLMRERARSPALEILRVVHPSAVVARSADIGPGSIVMAGAVVSNGCNVGTGVLLGTRSSLDHDSVLADFGSLAPGVTTGGGVRIGDRTAIGLGANLIHGVTIGSNTVVGAGALVVDDLPDSVVAYGVPARVVRGREPGEPYLSET